MTGLGEDERKMCKMAISLCQNEHDNEVNEDCAKVRVFGTKIVITQEVRMLESKFMHLNNQRNS